MCPKSRTKKCIHTYAHTHHVVNETLFYRTLDFKFLQIAQSPIFFGPSTYQVVINFLVTVDFSSSAFSLFYTFTLLPYFSPPLTFSDNYRRKFTISLRCSRRPDLLFGGLDKNLFIAFTSARNSQKIQKNWEKNDFLRLK